MQMYANDRVGLSESVTNRHLRANLSVLVPSFAGIVSRQNSSNEKPNLLGRLEELLVFEILKNG